MSQICHVIQRVFAAWLLIGWLHQASVQQGQELSSIDPQSTRLHRKLACRRQFNRRLLPSSYTAIATARSRA